MIEQLKRLWSGAQEAVIGPDVDSKQATEDLIRGCRSQALDTAIAHAERQGDRTSWAYRILVEMRRDIDTLPVIEWNTSWAAPVGQARYDDPA